jgi:hypothetical protein
VKQCFNIGGKILIIFMLLPNLFQITTVMSSMIFFAAESVSSIQPHYEKNESRAHRDNSWYFEEQENVVNHTGNTAPGLTTFHPSHTSLMDENNFRDEYITYEAEDYAIRQFARQTSTQGLYDVFTNIRGNQSREIDKLSIVLVSDHSTSMNEQVGGHNRMYWLDQALENFTASLTQVMDQAHISSEDIRIGHVAFGSSVTTSGSTYVPLQNFTSATVTAINNVTPSSPPTNYTFTQAGLRQAGIMLQHEEADRKKIVILLTDGVPTYSNAITQAEDKNGNGIYEVGEISGTTTVNTGTIVGNNASRSPTRDIDFSQATNGSLTRRNLIGQSNVTSVPYYNSNFPATIYQADQLKEQGLEVHAIGIALQNGTADSNYSSGGSSQMLPGYSASQIEQNMQRLVSNSAYYLNAYDPTRLRDYLESTLMRFFNTVSSGSAQIKIGDRFDFANNTLTTSYFEWGQERASNTQAIYNTETRTININQLNLGEGEEIQLHHQVHINTEQLDFAANVWQFISDPEQSFFKATPQKSPHPFAVPSGRAPGTTIDLKKVWHDRENLDQIRPKEIILEIIREETGAKESWKLGEFTMSGDSNASFWEEKGISALKVGTTSVELPLYNNRGETFKYRILDEQALGEIYGKRIEGLEIDNFERWNFELIKESTQGSSGQGATFSLFEEENPQEILSGFSQEGGRVEWDRADFRFQVGKTYHLVESQALPGHHKAGPWRISVNNNNEIKIIPEDLNDVQSVASYELQGATFKVRLLNEQKIQRITGEKIWEGDQNYENFRPEEVIIELYRNGEKIEEKSVSAETGWFYDFGYHAQEDASGEVYVYEVHEVPVSHYEGKQGENFNLVNVFNPSTIDIPVTKTWEDGQNFAGYRPEFIQIRLFQDGKIYEEVRVSGDRNVSQWSYTFSHLPEYKNRTERYHYSIEEVEVPRNYRSEISPSNRFHLINQFVPETIQITGKKIWIDDNDWANQRPDEITIRLMQSTSGLENASSEVSRQIVRAEDNWTFSFDHLAKYDYSGASPVEIHYFIIEEMDERSTRLYQSDITLEEEHHFRITNTFEPRLLLSVDKIDADFGLGMQGVKFDLQEVEIGEQGIPNIVGTPYMLVSNEEGRLSIDTDEQRTPIQPLHHFLPQFDTEIVLGTKEVQDKILLKNIELEYGKKYRLVMSPHEANGPWWAMPNPNNDWLIETPETYSEALLIGGAEESHPTRPKDLVSTIVNRRSLLRIPGDQSGIRLGEDASLEVDETQTPTLWFEISSNLLHNFIIRKVDRMTNEPMRVTFRLAWQYQFKPASNFDSLHSIDTSAMFLERNSPKPDLSNRGEPDTWAGATLTTSAVTGEKALGHMNRGALYILTEDEPEGYEPSSVVIVVYMDQSQAFHTRFAKRAIFEETGELVFMANEDVPEFVSLDTEELRLTFSNLQSPITPPSKPEGEDSPPKEPITEENTEDNSKEQLDDKHGLDRLPKLGTIIGLLGFIGVLILIIILIYLSRSKNKVDK